MGQIRKINDFYYIEFHARGLLYSQIAGKNIEEAQRLLKEVEEKISRGEALTIARHIELVDFFERFLSDLRILPFSPKTISRFESTMKHFSVFLKHDYPQVHQLSDLTPSIIESYKSFLVKNQKVKIVNFSILLIRDILEFGIKLGFINDNPSLHVRLLPWPQVTIRKQTVRYERIKELVSKNVGLSKLSYLLNFSDIACVMYYAHLIPLSRDDIYRTNV